MTTKQKHPNGKPHDGTVAEAKAVHLEARGQDAQHEEALLDAAIEHTFPASDPVAELPAVASSAKVIDSEDQQLDKAIEMTFPASDPVAVSNITKIVPVKSDGASGHKKTR